MDAWKLIASTVASGLIAWLAWHVSTDLIPLSLLFPAVVMKQSSRVGAALVTIAYWGVASWPVVPICAAYFVSGDNYAAGLLPWAVASAILSAPWILLWNAAHSQLYWRIPAAFLLCAAPPIGIINWASPLTAAGLLFPGSGGAGLLAVMLAPVFVALREWVLVIGLAVVSIGSNLIHVDGPPKSNWVGVDTAFGSIHVARDPIIEFTAAEQIQRNALDSTAGVIVFPEAVVHRWTEATDSYWGPALDELKARGATIVVGAGLPSAHSPDEFRNAVVIKGSFAAPAFEQRIPVPLAMWKPWGGKDRVPLRLFGAPTVEIACERTAVLICYEQLLPWLYLTAFWREPTVVVGVSNAHWTKATVVPRNQNAALRAWGRLFDKPVISATNY